MKKTAMVIGFGALCLAACETPLPADVSESPAYQRGYADGCITANERSKSFGSEVTRDEASFASDRAYAAGWRQGYGSCNRSELSVSTGEDLLGERNDRR